jgi:hypothetical protein
MLQLAEAVRHLAITALTAVTTMAAMAIPTPSTGCKLAPPALQPALADAQPLRHPPCRGTGCHSAVQDFQRSLAIRRGDEINQRNSRCAPPLFFFWGGGG